ncbi:hypothetical protein [Dictyobacter halimunensis]|uniref:hypothetical protein n=1 Tax=Dictyobacter halimunensis TaxID=3026934 RepID=UPI0030C73942
MWNNKAKTALIAIVCFLVVGIAYFGSVIGSQVANAAPASPSQAHSASTSNKVTTNASINGVTTQASAFRVTGIDMSVTPSTTSLWRCGSYIQVVYHATFHVNSGPNGGTIVFSYTINNGRSQTMEKLTILPGQHLSDFTFTWQGSLPADHFYPEPGGVMVTSPNTLVSKLVAPAGHCR